MMLVSFAQAIAHRRLDPVDVDQMDITLKIAAASRAVANHLESSVIFQNVLDSAGETILNSAGDPIGIPEDIQMATLYLIGWLDRNRDEDPDKAFGDFFPWPVMVLLRPYRLPALR